MAENSSEDETGNDEIGGPNPIGEFSEAMNDKILNYQDDGTSKVSTSYAEQSGAAHLHMEQHKNEETSSRADDKDIPDCNIFGSDSQHQDDTLTEPADDQMSDISGMFRDMDGSNDRDQVVKLELVFNACKSLWYAQEG